MLINTGGRTDIANYYGEWLMNRIREGYVLSRNPLFPQKIYRFRLSPDVVDCMIFCTKNPAPMLEHLDELSAHGFQVFFYVTITGYGKDLEPQVPDYHEVMQTFRTLSKRIGKNRIAWRYDPILITEAYSAAYHLKCFEEMAEALAPWTGFCIFSFVELYKKLAYTFPELRAVTEKDKRTLLRGMGEIAQKYQIRLQTCGDGRDYSEYGIARSGCITAPIMELALGQDLKSIPRQPSRPGCGCLPNQDIGAYDTCPNGCRYCYATKDHKLALLNYHRHNPKSPLLIGDVRPGDEIIEAGQQSFLQGFSQLSLELD